jgi:hypothetical protein
LASAPKLFEREHLADPAEVRIEELERLVGKLTLELDVAKQAFKLLELPSTGNEL